MFSKKLLAYFLVIAMVIISFPSTSYAESSNEVTLWNQLQSGEGNDNGNNAAYITLDNEAAVGVTSGIMTYTYKPLTDEANTRFITTLNITAGNSYYGIGHDNSSKWFWDNKAAGSYASISGLELPQANSEHSVKIRFDNDDVQFTLDNGEVKSIKLEGLKDIGAQIGLRAGYYDNAATRIQFKDFQLTDLEGNSIVALGEDTWTVHSAFANSFAQVTEEEPVVVESPWRQLRSGEGNDNGNNAAYITLGNDLAKGLTSGIITYTYKPLSNESMTRFITALNLSASNMYSGIGHDISSKWFWDNKSTGTYGSIGGLELPQANSEHSVKIRFEDDDVLFTLDDEEEKSVTLAGLKDLGSLITLRAGYFNDEPTIIQFKDFRVTDLDGQDIVAIGTDVWQVNSAFADSYTENVTSILKVNVSGVISDSNGEAIEGAQVSFGDQNSVTNNMGAFTFTEVVDGDYSLIVTKEGYNNLLRQVVVNDEDVIMNDIILSEIDPVISGNPWRQLQSGSGNDNGQKAAYILLNNEETQDLRNGIIKFKYRHISEFDETRAMILAHMSASKDYYGVGHNATGWFWDTTASGYGGLGNIPKTVANQEYSIELRYTDEEVTITLDNIHTQSKTISAMNGITSPIGLRAGSFRAENSIIQFKDFTVTDLQGNVLVAPGADTWDFYTSGGEAVFIEEVIPPAEVSVTGKVVDEQGDAIQNATVELGSNSTTTNSLGEYLFNSILTGNHNVVVSMDGFTNSEQQIVVEREDINIGTIILKLPEPLTIDFSHKISSAIMDVAVDMDFPRVIGYKMKTLENKLMAGQSEAISTIIVNSNITIVPEVSCELIENKAIYTMVVNNGTDSQAATVDAIVTAELAVTDNILEFKVTNIENIIEHSIQSLYIPNHNLISVNSSQSGAKFDGGNVEVNVRKSGDTHKSIIAMNNGLSGYMIGMVSADGLSAAIWSNSQSNYGSGNVIKGDWKSITAETKTVESIKTTGLYSSTWTYELPKTNYRTEALPWERVVVVGDENSDGMIDWQDSAIGYRGIMEIPTGAKRVPDRVAYRIAMNFGSQGANPFLKSLDNVKKVYLSTDGLGQSILLKGYGSEGHDSGHLNYADIGSRIGGAEDMKTLLEKGELFGADFGIHVNASETYPESKYFTEDRLSKKADGSYYYGWNWIDQGINIDALYDLNNGRKDRFNDLYEVLGGADNHLDYIYVDVWGNGQSGDNGSWASRQLADEIHSFDWAVGGEWGYAFSNDAIFQHWAADLTYGGYQLKGVNSSIIRFVKNSQRDSWVGDYPTYGGAAVNPLLGGYDMKDFEGWQGRSDYGSYIINLFADNIPTKFVQHFDCTKWVEGNEVSLSGESWTPEMEVELQNSTGDTLNIKRQSNDANSAEYQLRDMTLNGKTIMDGNQYLIPWNWDTEGNTVSTDLEKLYHFNESSNETTTTWSIPSSWSGLTSVVVYELTQDGKTNETSVPVVNGDITLTAKANIPYVVYKGETVQTEITWSEGMHLTDVGFNSGHLEAWNLTGDQDSLSVLNSQVSNRILAIENPSELTSLTQTLTDLEAGKQYAVYVGVDNRSDMKAYIEVDVDGTTISNNTGRSVAKNYVKSDAHSTNMPTVGGTSYFQNMYVFFTAPSTGNVTLTLKRDPGQGTTYMDDIRVCSNESDMYKSSMVFKQDFEEVTQGLFPFVVGSAENVEDNRVHLSEKNAPYTQQGWNGAGLNDVIDGNWSLKVNGLTQRNTIVFQTIPQNYRFEKDKEYEITFEYGMGTDNIYLLIVGHGDGNIDESYELLGNINEDEITYTFTMNGLDSEDGWFGIYSTSTPADPSGMLGDKETFSGIGNFVIDNLKIIEKEGNITGLELDATEKTIKVGETFTLNPTIMPTNVEFEPLVWTSSDTQIATIENGIVKAVGKGVVTITVMTAEGGFRDICTVTVINANNGQSNNNNSNNSGSSSQPKDTDDIEDDETPENLMTFTDLENYKWALPNIQRLYELDIIKGNGNNEFLPGDPITRSDLTCIIVRAYDLKAEKQVNYFDDVDPSKYYADSVNIAATNLIVKGVGGGLFKPKASITREDLILIIYRALKDRGEIEAVSGDYLKSFDDQDQVSNYAREAVNALVEMGIIKGSNNMLNPKENCTRAEAATIIDRAIN